MDTVSELLDGIDEELAKTSRYLKFTVTDVKQQGAIWKLFVDRGKSSGSLDEALEGAAAWWPGPPKGSADVLSVISDADQVNLRFLTSSPPKVGEELRIYPPRFLEALSDCWQIDSWARQCLAWADRLEQSDPEELGGRDPIPGFPKLREAQRQAFELFEREFGFLHGPPGTGKTYTLGAMLAKYLCDNPKHRILLLSTTNSATDQALISVDERLEELAKHIFHANQLRKKCLRIGNHFVASKYKGREHLLPTPDENLIKQLAALETSRPDPSDVVAYARWKDEIRALRQKIPKPLELAQLAAMTTTGAAFMFESLYARKPFDLIIFDEASQVSLAHAFALAPLGKRVLFAGDDQQLAPVVQSQHPHALKWLGRSPFVFNKQKGACLLNEQGRMEESICDVVSNVFYKGKLIVAGDCETNAIWRSERLVRDVPPMQRKNVHLELCPEEGMFHAGYGGPVRFASAKFIAELVPRLLQNLHPDQITVLTPFRAQRTLIKSKLREGRVRDLNVSTVHRAQGAECHTIIFDPVMANTDFFDQHMGGPRLINVALSRAQARLVIVASKFDLEYQWLKRISIVISNSDNDDEEALALDDIVFDKKFPAAFFGTVVRYKKFLGSLEKGGNIGNFTIVNFRDGRPISFQTETVRKQCAGPVNS